MNATAISPDLLALVLACRAQPEEWTPQLAFSDWLDENPLPDKECGACKGVGRIPPNGPLYKSDPAAWNRGVPCVLCEKSGSIPDTDRADRATLIRTTCELESHQWGRADNCNYGKPEHYIGPVNGHDAKLGHPCPRCNPDSKPLVALVRDLQARLSVWPCPTCKDHPGLVDGPPGEWRHTAALCPACGGSGDVLRVHTATVRGVIDTLQFDLAFRAGYPSFATLPRMVGDAVERVVLQDNHGGYEEFRPTPRLRALTDPEHPPPWGVPLEGVIVGDREPHWNGAAYCWFKEGRVHPSSATPESAVLPPPVFDAIDRAGSEVLDRWKGEVTAELATLALARTLFRFGAAS